LTEATSDPNELNHALWAHTAKPAPVTQPLMRDAAADVAIIGGGYAGLSTALHLAEAGFSVMVLEAHGIGWGASGRSGGQVIPGIKFDPDGMRRLFGEEGGKAAAEAFGSTADRTFRLIDRYGIACDATNRGWVQPAHSKAALTTVRDRCRQWERLGADVAPLSKAEVADLLGTELYEGGWIDRRGGSVQPLSYTRGLARACLDLGVEIAIATRAKDIVASGDQWRVITDRGASVRADRVVVCTNGYSNALWPGVEKTIIAANSFQIATTPLPRPAHDRILKGGVVASDTRQLLSYWRRDAAGRLLLGGRGTFTDPQSPEDFAHLERNLRRIYPEVAEQPIEFRWFGRVAITRDFLPHIHEPAPGILVLVGCQGRGVALYTAMGEWLAGYIATGEESALPLPITRIRPIPAHALRRLYVSAVISWYRVRDALPV
jgi:glycine/D-amino acid oxidase-like deaminating enzyme